MEPLPSVEAARGQRAAARDLAEAKGLEARELVRQRYFELIESADAIVALSVAAKEVSDFVEGVEGRVAHALALSDDSPDPSEKSWRLEAVEAEPAAAIVATAPYLWRALDMDDHATAARIFVDCKSYSQRLRKAQRATLAPYVRQLGRRVAASAAAFCASARDAPAEAHADALAAWLVVHREARVADALAVFREARTLWIDEDCGDGDGDVELKLRRATRSVRRSLVDVSALFFGAEALVPMRLPRLDASRSADPLEAARVRDFAADWAADAVARVRRSATRTLSAIGDASTARLRQLFVSLRAECSQGLGELVSASTLLFVEASGRAALDFGSRRHLARRQLRDEAFESLALQEAQEAYCAGRKRVFLDVFSDPNREVVLDADESQIAIKCDLWASIFLPAFAACVAARLDRALDASLAHFRLVLDALSRGLDASDRIGAAEVSFGAERAAAWLDRQVGSLYCDADALCRGLGGSAAPLSARFAETLACAASALRRRAQAQSSSLVALCLGRVAWRLRSCACLLKAAGRCGAVAEEDAEESEVNVHQLRAAFEIADADGEDDAAAADCADAAGAIMCSGTIAHRARRGALRPGLEKFAQTLTFDEFVLLSTRSLNAQTRRQTHQRLDACLVRAANCGFAAWAAAEVRPAVQGFDKHLELHVQEWATCAGQFDKAKRLDRLKAAARWRLRSLDVETAAGDAAVEEARLPCELSAGCAALLHALHDSLAKAVCGADFVAQAGDEAFSAHEHARVALLAAAAPKLAETFERALKGAEGRGGAAAELAALALIIDAHVLSRGLGRCAAAATQLDAGKAQAIGDAGARLFSSVFRRIDAVDGELYTPFVEADASRAYSRSALFLDVLFGPAAEGISHFATPDDFEARANSALPLAKAAAAFQRPAKFATKRVEAPPAPAAALVAAAAPRKGLGGLFR